MDKESARIIIQSKNTGIGVFLALFFGGPGVFYASITGGIVMTIAEVISVFLCFFLIGFILLPLVHLGSLIWVIVSINDHNKKLLMTAYP